MKRQYIFRGLMAMMLLMAAVQDMTAQEAFYIYRNDGEFNGFFYDQVKRMNYSKIDFNGIEHDEYVIQEVETDDSLYRIPLLAIDSISFVQPEIKFNPRLKNLAGSLADHFSVNSRARGGSGDRMTDWVRKVDPGYNYFLYFDLNTPEELLPKEGDVLVDFYDPKYKMDDDEDEDYSGFSGKVSSIIKSSDYWTVRTEPLTSLSDIFVQFVTVEEVSGDEVNGVRRRLAGMPENRADTRMADAGTATLLDLSPTLKQDFEVGNGKIGVEFGVGMKVKLGVTYNISMSNLYVKTIMTEEFKMQGSVSGKYDGDYEAEILGLPKRLSSVKFPAVAPVFQTRPIPNAFLRLKGEMGAKLDLPAVGFKAKQVVTFDTDSSPMMYSSTDVTGPDGEPQKGILDGSDLTLYMNGSVQIGAKFSANIETNDWIDAVFHSGIYADFYVGPQVDGQIELKTNLADLATGNVPNLYSSMKKSHISLTGLAANAEVKGRLKVLSNEDDQTFLELNQKWFEKTWYLFPDFSASTADYDQGSGLINCKVEAHGSVFVPQYFGMGVYNAEGTCLEKKFNNRPYFLTETLNVMECTFDMPCGRYWLRPLLNVADAEIEVDDPLAEREVVVTPVLYHEKANKTDSVLVGSEMEKVEILFNTNAEKVEIYSLEPDNTLYHLSEDFAFVDEATPGYTVRKLTFLTGKNPAPVPQQWDLVLKAIAGTFESADTIHIKQEPSHPQRMYVTIDIIKPMIGSTHQWGENSDGPYDVTKDYSDGFSATTVPVSCSYNGNILTLSGSHTVGDPNEKTEIRNEPKYYKETSTKYSTYTVSLTIDLDSAYCTSGSIETIDYWKSVYYGKNTIADNFYIEENSESISEGSEYGRWSSIIPFGTPPSDTYLSRGLEDEPDPDGYLSFFSDKTDGISCGKSFEYHNKYNMYDYRDGSLYKSTHHNNNEVYSLTGASDDNSYIYISIAYYNK